MSSGGFGTESALRTHASPDRPAALLNAVSVALNAEEIVLGAADGAPPAGGPAKAAPLAAPVTLVAAGDRRHTARLRVDGGEHGTLELRASFAGRATLDLRGSAALRVAGRVLPVLLPDPAERPETVDIDVEDRVVLASSQALIELALTATSYAQIIGAATTALAAIAGTTSVGVAIANESGYLQALPGSFGAAQQLVESSHVDITATSTFAASAYHSGRTQVTENPMTDIPPWFRDWARAFGVERLMTLPLSIGTRTIGVVHVANKPTPFTDDDERRAARLAPFLAGAVAQLGQRLQLERQTELAATIERAVSSVASDEPSARLADHLDELRRTLRARTAVVAFRDDGPTLEVGGGHDPIDEAFRARTLRDTSPTRASAVWPRTPGDRGHAEISTPIVVANMARAQLSILRVPCEPFSEHEIAVVQRMAGIAALAWATDRFRSERAETARLREQQRIADELHEHVAQIMFSGTLVLQAVFERLEATSPSRERVRQALDLLMRSEASIRDTIHRLSGSAGRAPLVDRLSELVQEIEEVYGRPIRVEIVTRRIEMTRGLDGATTDALVNAAREALSNAARHAGDCHITCALRVTANRRVVIKITDSGRGFDTTLLRGGFARARRKLGDAGGGVVVGSTPGRGTHVLMTAQLAPGEHARGKT